MASKIIKKEKLSVEKSIDNAFATDRIVKRAILSAANYELKKYYIKKIMILADKIAKIIILDVRVTKSDF